MVLAGHFAAARERMKGTRYEDFPYERTASFWDERDAPKR